MFSPKSGHPGRASGRASAKRSRVFMRFLSMTHDPLFTLLFGIGASSALFVVLIALHNEEVEQGERQRLAQVQRAFASERSGNDAR